MVLLKSMPFSKTVTAKQLIDAGMPRAIFWNTLMKHRDKLSDKLIDSVINHTNNTLACA